MQPRTADPRSNAAVGVCASPLPEQLPDDPAALKALLREQQHAFELAFKAREAELQKAFEARILELYEQLRLARRRMFGPSSESHAGQGWLFDEAEALAESATEAGDTATLPPPATETTGETPADTGKKKARGKRKPLPIERKRSTNPIFPGLATP